MAGTSTAPLQIAPSLKRKKPRSRPLPVVSTGQWAVPGEGELQTADFAMAPPRPLLYLRAC